MSTLLLRLAAPLQSWGAGAKFDRRRETQRFPTKSGVLGLLAAALGRARADSVEDLNGLAMGVRLDQEGELLRDYHTAVPLGKQAYITNRYYLSDAVFLVGLQGEETLLASLEKALENPVFPLSLGRRSCPPTGRLCLGMRSGKTVAQALQEEPWQASAWYRASNAKVAKLQMLLEAGPQTAGAFYLRDVPLSFDQAHRQHAFRSLVVQSVPLPSQAGRAPVYGGDATRHDAFHDWGDG